MTGRMIIRLRLHNKLRLDDFCVGFAAVCLAGATGLSYYAMSLNHFIEQLSTNLSQSPGGGIDDAAALQHLIFFQRCVWAYSVLSWTVIFATKFGYLCIFKNLVDRIPPCMLFGSLWFCSPSWPSDSHSVVFGYFAQMMASLVVSNTKLLDALYFLMTSQQADAFRSLSNIVGRSV